MQSQSVGTAKEKLQKNNGLLANSCVYVRMFWNFQLWIKMPGFQNQQTTQREFM